MRSPQTKKIFLLGLLIILFAGTILFLHRSPSNPPANGQAQSASAPSSPSSSAENDNDRSQRMIPPAVVSTQVETPGITKQSTSSGQGGLSGKSSASTLGRSSTTAPAAPTVIQRSAGPCFTLTFSHPSISSHADGEKCLRHKNVLTLHHPDQSSQTSVNPKSVCISVNGNNVAHTPVTGHSDQVVIGANAGPHAKIQARYCIGAVVCPEKCKIRRDEFLEALGMEEDETQAQSVGWDGSKDVSKDEAELEKEVATLDDSTPGSKVPAKFEVFSGWVTESSMTGCTPRAETQKKGGSHELHADRNS